MRIRSVLLLIAGLGMTAAFNIALANGYFGAVPALWVKAIAILSLCLWVAASLPHEFVRRLVQNHTMLSFFMFLSGGMCFGVLIWAIVRAHPVTAEPVANTPQVIENPPTISPPTREPPKPNAAPPVGNAIREPVVHIEPEHELIWSTGPNHKVGEHHLKLSNTGTEDIDHIVVTEDYFVALKLPNIGIIIKNVGGVPVESGVCTSLGTKKDCQILINFAPVIAVMNEVAQNNRAPNRLGVRLTITFRRKVDGASYKIVKGYGIIGPHAEGLFPPGVPQDNVPLELRSQFLSMSEVVPYLDLSEYWTSVVHDIGQDSQGNITSRYH